MERRRNVKRWLLAAAALIAAGLAGLGIWIDREASAPDLKPEIEKAVGNFLGRPVTLDALVWRRWPATLVGKGFKVYDNQAKTRLLAESPAVEADIALLSLFKFAAGVTELRFVSPLIHLRRGADGEWNAARLVREIAARPDEKNRHWGTLAFNWFAIAGGTVTIDDAAGGLDGLPALGVEGRGKLKFGRGRLQFPFELNIRPQGTSASIALSGRIGGRWRLHAALKHASPALVGLAWPAAARWTGTLDGELDRDESAGPGWKLRARAAPLALSTSAPLIELLEVSGEYLPAASSSFNAVLRSSATEIEAKGTLRGTSLDVDVKSSETDASVLLALAGALSKPPLSGPSPAPHGAATTRGVGSSAATPRRLTVRISADDLRWGAADLRAARAVVRRSTGAYAIEDASFRTLGGVVTGAGFFLPGGGDGALSVSWTASGLDLQQLLRAAGTTREAAGSLDSTGRIATGLEERFLPAMNGAVSVDLKNGWLGGMPGLLKVLSRLNLSTLFAEAKGHHQARVPFDEAHAAATIEKGKLSTSRPLLLKNKTLQLAFIGSYDLPSRTVDGKVVVHVLTVTDEIVKLIPGVRDILLGGRKSMLPIWLKVTGKAEDPDVDVMQAKTITAPVWNTIKNVFRLPKTLWKDLGL